MTNYIYYCPFAGNGITHIQITFVTIHDKLVVKSPRPIYRNRSINSTVFNRKQLGYSIVLLTIVRAY